MSDFKLTKADKIAISNYDSNYILDKGAKLYVDGTFKDSVEYYRLASSMGNIQATSNLGYCYLYGRDIEINVDLAIAYFTIAANKGNIDALYKLGDIYSRDKWVEADKELSLYYYNTALDYILKDKIECYDDIRWIDVLDDYPSLCFALGREMFIGGSMNTNLKLSFQLLKHAEIGYKREIENGVKFYDDCYESVLAYLECEEFKEEREAYEAKNDEEDFPF